MAGAARCRPLARGRPLTQRAPGESVGHTGDSACPLKETEGNPPATTRRLCLPPRSSYRRPLAVFAWQRASHNTHVWLERAGAQGHPIVRVARATRSLGFRLADLATRDYRITRRAARQSRTRAADRVPPPPLRPPVASTPLPTSLGPSSSSHTRGLSRRYSAAGIPPHDGDIRRTVTAFRACFLWISSARSVAAVEKERARCFHMLPCRPVLVLSRALFAQHSR